MRFKLKHNYFNT